MAIGLWKREDMERDGRRTTPQPVRGNEGVAPKLRILARRSDARAVSQGVLAQVPAGARSVGERRPVRRGEVAEAAAQAVVGVEGGQVGEPPAPLAEGEEQPDVLDADPERVGEGHPSVAAAGEDEVANAVEMLPLGAEVAAAQEGAEGSQEGDVHERDRLLVADARGVDVPDAARAALPEAVDVLDVVEADESLTY